MWDANDTSNTIIFKEYNFKKALEALHESVHMFFAKIDLNGHQTHHQKQVIIIVNILMDSIFSISRLYIFTILNVTLQLNINIHKNS